MDGEAASTGFAESPENVPLIDPNRINGVWWLPEPFRAIKTYHYFAL